MLLFVVELDGFIFTSTWFNSILREIERLIIFLVNVVLYMKPMFC